MRRDDRVWRKRNKNRRKRYGTKQRRQNKHAKKPNDPLPPITNRLYDIERTIWKVMGVASCMEFASDSMLAETPGKPDMQHSAAAVHSMLDELCQPIEDIIEELGGIDEKELEHART